MPVRHLHRLPLGRPGGTDRGPGIRRVARAFRLGLRLALMLAGVGGNPPDARAEAAGPVVSEAAVESFRREVKPLLVQYCFDCHGDGANKGKVAFDGFKSDAELLAQSELWLAVLRNVRAGLMPPEKKPRPAPEEVQQLARWIKSGAFGLDPANPDPGRVTLRRLNRVEYGNTIRDLMGFDFKVDEELPPDDSGYGFDNIGDVLNLSPLLLEKYMQAAEAIAAGAVPRVNRVVAERSLNAQAFKVTTKAPEPTRPAGTNGVNKGERKRPRNGFSFYDHTEAVHRLKVDTAGDYRLFLELETAGEFDFDPGRCRVVFTAGDRELLRQEFGWRDHQRHKFEWNQTLPTGEFPLRLSVTPLTPPERRSNSLTLRLSGLRIEGPTAREHWVRPRNFDRFFTQDPPDDPAERTAYARAVLARFADRAWRRPAPSNRVERLLAIAQETWRQPGQGFADGIAAAMVPVLASPAFLFRLEQGEPGAAGTNAIVFLDDYSLASRLSYFLWSTMPDAELFRLAAAGQLRTNLPAQVRRMIADQRSRQFIENFVGQWLQTRDVDGIDINSFAVLGRDAGQDAELRQSRQRLDELRAKTSLTPAEEKEREQLIERRRKRFGNRPMVELDRELRQAMRQETEQAFAHIVRGDRSVLELLDADYTFLNERLARHYGLTNVTGSEVRKVSLPAGHPRGGVLTHGAVLIVTSNPTRTSPVKRGLFVLDNILGIPPPPAPPNVPQLEASEKAVAGHEPTLRETLAIHREQPLCASCHNRMDPLGLALENFNALGMWRTTERGQAIDAAGRLITGESFKDIRELKHVLVTRHREDFYRCLSEKLLTYALGRGLDHRDVATVDQLVARLETENGRFGALLDGIIESAPFQKRRNEPMAADVQSAVRQAPPVLK